MPATYEPIATSTATATVRTIEFASIPQTYTDLVAVVEMVNTTSSAYNYLIRVGNSSLDTGTNYTTQIHSSGLSNNPVSHRYRNSTFFREHNVGAQNNNDHMSIVNFMDYSNTTTWKPINMRSDMASLALEHNVGTWRSTSAINIIAFTLDFDNDRVASGSTVTLYGIKAA